jgi:hypothetical protein
MDAGIEEDPLTPALSRWEREKGTGSVSYLKKPTLMSSLPERVG